MKNKKGLFFSNLIVGIFLILFIAIFLGVYLYSFNSIDDILDQDIDIGQVNLRTVNDQSFGQVLRSRL